MTGAKIPIVEVDVDDDPMQAQQFGVRSMPTVVILRDGREVGRSSERDRALLSPVLSRAP